MIGSVVIHHRTPTCESRNGLCPSWIWHHIGDYLSPLWRHVELTVVAVAVGFVIAFDVLMAYRLTGGAMNPARAFGPELAGNHWSHFWVWYVGPLAGAVIAASLYELLYLRPERPAPVGPAESGVEEPGVGRAALS